MLEFPLRSTPAAMTGLLEDKSIFKFYSYVLYRDRWSCTRILAYQCIAGYDSFAPTAYSKMCSASRNKRTREINYNNRILDTRASNFLLGLANGLYGLGGPRALIRESWKYF